MNADYKKLAYERSVILALVRFIKDELLPADVHESPLRQVFCEELPQSDSPVPEDAIYEVLDSLEQRAHAVAMDLRGFVFVRKDCTDVHTDTPRRKRSRKRKRKKGRATSISAAPTGAEEG